MYPIQHPATTKLIQKAYVNARPGDEIRTAIGKALIAIGARIEPARARRPVAVRPPR